MSYVFLYSNLEMYYVKLSAKVPKGLTVEPEDIFEVNLDKIRQVVKMLCHFEMFGYVKE